MEAITTTKSITLHPLVTPDGMKAQESSNDRARESQLLFCLFISESDMFLKLSPHYRGERIGTYGKEISARGWSKAVQFIGIY